MADLKGWEAITVQCQLLPLWPRCAQGAKAIVPAIKSDAGRWTPNPTDPKGRIGGPALASNPDAGAARA